MAKVKYDYDGVDDTKVGYDGDEPTPGIYAAKVVSADVGKSSNQNPMITVVLEITEGKFKGWRGWHYLVQTEESLWKTKEFTDALGLTQPGKKKGAWDTDDAVGKKCRVKTKREMYEGEARAKVRSVLAAKKDEDADEDDEPDTEAAEDATTDEPDDEPEGEEPEGEEEDDEDEDEDDAQAERRAALEGMNRAALKKALAASGSDLKVTSKVSDEDIVEAILEAEFSEEEDEEDDEETWSWDDIKDEDRAGLKKIIADEELDVKVTKKMSDDALRAAVAAALEIEVEGEPPF